MLRATAVTTIRAGKCSSSLLKCRYGIHSNIRFFSTTMSKRWNSHQHMVAADIHEDDESNNRGDSNDDNKDRVLPTSSWKAAARSKPNHNDKTATYKQGLQQQPMGRFTTPSVAPKKASQERHPQQQPPLPSPTTVNNFRNDNTNTSNSNSSTFDKLRSVFSRSKEQEKQKLYQSRKKEENQTKHQHSNANANNPIQIESLFQQTELEETKTKYTPKNHHSVSIDTVVKQYYQQQQQQQQHDNDDDYQNQYLQVKNTNNNDKNSNSSTWRNNVVNLMHNKRQQQQPLSRYNVNIKNNSMIDYTNKKNQPKTKNNRIPITSIEGKIVELPTFSRTIAISSLSERCRISIPQLKRFMQKFGIMDQQQKMQKRKKKMPDTFIEQNTKQIQREISITIEEAELLLLEIGGYQIIRKEDINDTINTTATDSSTANQRLRPPVVCIMGHVDHGKTTLMDALRKYAKLQHESTQKTDENLTTGNHNNNIAGTEAGGITQMISAFQITLPTTTTDNSNVSKDDNMQQVATFLDTPGHAAFSRMRHCGLHATDVLVLVIAADDGVKEQTIEIINMIPKNSAMRVIVAMTKIDKPFIDVEKSIEKLENELLMNGIETEGVGGDIPIVPVSGITSQGLDVLMQSISMSSQDLYCSAEQEEEQEGIGIVLDARMEKGVGVVAECVVRSGQFVKGGYVVVERQDGRIRLLKNVFNQVVEMANASDPIRLIGLDKLPKAGESIICVRSEERAQEIISKRELIHQYSTANNNNINNMDKDSSSEGHTSKRPSRVNDPIADLQITNNKSDGHRTKALKRFGLIDGNADTIINDSNDSDSNTAIRIPIIIKSDAHGTLHAIESALLGIAAQSKHSMLIDPIRCAVGPINSADIILALESDAPIFGFNVSKDKAVVDSRGVIIKNGNIIYNLIDEAKEVFASFLPPTVVDKIQGSASVQAVYDLNDKKNGKKIAGCRITDGTLFLDKCSTSGLKVTYRVLRAGQVISRNNLRAESLKKFKENVTQMRRGEECGLGLENFDDMQEGDVIECFTTQEIKVFV